jgi:chemotaxis protein CheY-P-specific phosphatase CheC
MHVDADSLEQLNLTTREGAERAAAALADRTGAATRLGTTKITLLGEDDLAGEMATVDGECVAFELSGALSGRVWLAFDEAAGRFPDADADGSVTALTATATSLVESFVDEWEAHVGEALTVGPPERVPDPADHEFTLGTVTPDTESTPVFRSRIRVDEGGTVTLFLAPDESSLGALLSSGALGGDDSIATDSEAEFGMGDGAPDFDADDAAAAFDIDSGDTGDALDSEDAGGAFGSDSDDEGGLFEDGEQPSLSLEKLSVFSDLTREGTAAAAERVTAMTGFETETEISGVTFTPIDDIAARLESGDYVGATAEFGGTPGGALVVLFRADTAVDIAEAMLPMEPPEGDGLTDMHESALAELSNVTISGFIDGWANVLGTTVDHTPPAFESDMEMRMLELVTDQLGPFQTHAYTVESRIETDGLDFDCGIYALPDESKLSAALDALTVENSDRVTADPKEIF